MFAESSGIKRFNRPHCSNHASGRGNEDRLSASPTLIVFHLHERNPIVLLRPIYQPTNTILGPLWAFFAPTRDKICFFIYLLREKRNQDFDVLTKISPEVAGIRNI